MRILSFKPNHDGTIACVEDGELAFSIEAEKNSYFRHSVILPSTVLYALKELRGLPDVIAVSGWEDLDSYSAKYVGISKSEVIIKDTTFAGKKCKQFSSSHERSHVIGTFGLSHFPENTPHYSLCWEGGLGSFYEVDENLEAEVLANLLLEPGERYAFLFHLACDSDKPQSEPGDAGKLMALASFSDRSPPNDMEKEFIDRILSDFGRNTHTKLDFANSPYFKIGPEHAAVKQLAGKLSDEIYNRFFEFAEKNMTKKLPLIISGGCGLNCEWNTKWKNCGLFPEVFVPPCANDSGSALGTAIDAQFILTGKSKIKWSVYAGEEFSNDTENLPPGFKRSPLNFLEVASFLAKGRIIAWVQGRYEIGPRALGNRSLLAAPFEDETRDRLNIIKERESYRPIAPLCLEEDVSLHFNWNEPSPYMLYFQHVRARRLKAITHVDGSARVQTVSKLQNAKLYELLLAFRDVTGTGVLCNTSLNFKGKGFINQMSDLVKFVENKSIDGYVVGDSFYFKEEF